MVVKSEPLQYYIDRLQKGDHFSLGLYGDGEIIAMRRSSIGQWNALGEIYTDALGRDIEVTLNMENHILGTDPNFQGTGDAEWLDTTYGEKEWYDGVIWDRAVRLGELGPFIKQLQQMPVYVIGNKHLRKLEFLKYRELVEIPELNCYAAVGTIVAKCQNEGVYLISAGLAAIPIIGKLRDKFKQSFLLDMGSIWDVFCGIGAQRGWRAEAYANPELLNKIISDNLKCE